MHWSEPEIAIAIATHMKLGVFQKIEAQVFHQKIPFNYLHLDGLHMSCISIRPLVSIDILVFKSYRFLQHT